MHLDQTAMCPKHGIAHGVCVDPIKTTGGSTTSEPGYVKPSVTGEPAQHIPCSSETITLRFCPFEALDLIEKIAGDEQTREEGVGTLLTQVHALRAYITGMGK